MADRIDLHVGLPKTGTTSLQNLLFENRDALRVAGVDLVVETMHQAFQAARDLVHGGELAWATLADNVRNAAGRVLITCEGLSAVPPAHVAPGIEAFGCRDVRVVVTVRDPALVLPSVWQQLVRSGATLSMADFLHTVRDGMHWEWLHDPAEVLDTWATVVGAANVSVVVAPRTTEPSPLLWQRFAAACDVDVDVVPPAAQALRTNSSLDGGAIELVRQVNVALGDRAPAEGPRFRDLLQPLVKTLSKPGPGAPLRLPDADRDWVTTMAGDQVAALRHRAYAVYGDLAELVPAASGPAIAATDVASMRHASPQQDATDRGEPDPGAAAAIAPPALADLLMALRAARRRLAEAEQAADNEPARRRPARGERRGPHR